LLFVLQEERRMRKTPSRHHSVPSSYLHGRPERRHPRRRVVLNRGQRVAVVSGVLGTVLLFPDAALWLVLGVIAFHMLVRE
jgi:hypothetical protein